MDNFECLTDPTVEAFLGNFVEQAGDYCCLLIASQKTVQLPGTDQRWLPAVELGVNDLAFQPNEVQRLILQNFRENIPPELAKELTRLTGGWIIELSLLTQGLWKNMINSMLLAQGPSLELEEYLNQKFSAQPPDVQHFLLHTSLLQEFDVGQHFILTFGGTGMLLLTPI